MMPYRRWRDRGAHAGSRRAASGLRRRTRFPPARRLDLIAAAQGDGAVERPARSTRRRSWCSISRTWRRARTRAQFRRALPILGRDGTLWNIQPQSPAAGKVFAKTGTFSLFDPLNRRHDHHGKGTRRVHDDVERAAIGVCYLFSCTAAAPDAPTTADAAVINRRSDLARRAVPCSPVCGAQRTMRALPLGSTREALHKDAHPTAGCSSLIASFG